MKFLSIFDVIGPNMIGPSSSHTAGACSMALLACKMCPEPVRKVVFTLYGSFSKTYHGHGTDRALLGGILGFHTDDARIRDAFEWAEKMGVEYEFVIDEETKTCLLYTSAGLMRRTRQRTSARHQGRSRTSTFRVEKECGLTLRFTVDIQYRRIMIPCWRS